MVRTDIALAEYRLGLLSSDDLPGIALDWLSGGLDSPSLRVLAANTEIPGYEVEALFRKVLEETGLSIPDEDDAAILITGQWCRRIVDADVTPRKGADGIWRECVERLSSRTGRVKDVLDPFVYIADMYDYDDPPLSRAEIDRQVIELANDFLRNHLKV